MKGEMKYKETKSESSKSDRSGAKLGDLFGGIITPRKGGMPRSGSCSGSMSFKGSEHIK